MTPIFRFFLFLSILSPVQLLAEDIEAGRILFGLHCAACHSDSARGSGSMAQALKIDPPDLTVLRRTNSGRFPVAQVVSQIDGRSPLAAHGGSMPVYGWFFEGPARAITDHQGVVVDTTQPVAQIVAWLSSIQRR